MMSAIDRGWTLACYLAPEQAVPEYIFSVGVPNARRGYKWAAGPPLCPVESRRTFKTEMAARVAMAEAVASASSKYSAEIAKALLEALPDLAGMASKAESKSIYFEQASDGAYFRAEFTLG